MSPTDHELVRAARAGDRAALEMLLSRHYDRMHALCRRLTGNDADADDAAQEALLAVVRGLPRFDGRAAFTTWVYRVTVTACLDELRRRKRRPEPTDADAFGVAAENPGPALDTRVVDRLDLDAALAALPPEFRSAVVLRDQLGLDYAEIAEVLDIPAGTVRSRIARGRAALAQQLSGNQDHPGRRRTGAP